MGIFRRIELPRNRLQAAGQMLYSKRTYRKVNKQMCEAANKPIMLINMFSGKYPEDKIAHEIINIFKTDDGENYIYAPDDGSCNHEVSKVVMLRHHGRGRYEVLGIALVKSLVNEDDGEESQKKALKSMSYGYSSFEKIMKAGGQPFNDQEKITFKATRCVRPTSPVFITCSDESKVTRTLEQEIFLSKEDLSEDKTETGGSRKKLFGESQRSFIKKGSPYTKINNLFESSEYEWEEFPQLNSFSHKYAIDGPGFLGLIGQEEREIPYSNLLAYFLDNNTELCKSFIELMLDRWKGKNPEDNRPSNSVKEADTVAFDISREKEHVDILINTYDKIYVIENKVHSPLGVHNKKTGKHQLQTYVEKIEERFPDKDVYVFIICPIYNDLAANQEGVRVEIRKNNSTNVKIKRCVPIITYEDILELLSTNAHFKSYAEPLENMQADQMDMIYFEDFKKALEWQIRDHQKDLSQTFFNLSLKRFERAIKISKLLD